MAADLKGTVVVIPARGGSVGIPRKNVLPVGGKPLLVWVVRAGIEAKSVNAVVVATDDDEIAALAMDAGAQVFWRSAASATSEAPTEAVMAEVVSAHPEINVVVLAQATSPLTTGSDIDRCVAAWHSGDPGGSVVSVVRTHRFRWSQDGEPLNYEPTRRPRRQDWEGELVENGALYVSGAAAYRGKSPVRCPRPVTVVEMEADTLVEIDDAVDMTVVAALLDARHTQG